jgi:hypothetical protein
MVEGGPAAVKFGAAPEASRPSVVVVTYAWGVEWAEASAAVRLVSGALALNARVTIVHLDDPVTSLGRPRQDRLDGAFRVRSIPAARSHDARAALLRAAFMRQPGSVMPERALRGTLGLEARTGADTASVISGLQPDVLVLAGTGSFWSDALPLGSSGPRVVLLPLCGDDPVLSSNALRPLLARADAIGVFSAAEHRRVAGALSGSARQDRVQHLRLALPVNALAAATGMAGMAPFGPYLLVLSGLPGDPAGGPPPPHDFLREVLGDVAIAEVGPKSWAVTRGADRFEISWTPSRMILWRLMAGAEVMLDLRTQGPVGREAIESLLFGTPIVVPEGSVAAEHAADSNGGLWYLAPGEMTDCVATLLERTTLRETLGGNGKAWAEQWHSDTATFVDAARRLLMGE